MLFVLFFKAIREKSIIIFWFLAIFYNKIDIT
jgi:hypothetical protein